MQYECSTLDFVSRAQHNSEMKTAAIGSAPVIAAQNESPTNPQAAAQRLGPA